MLQFLSYLTIEVDCSSMFVVHKTTHTSDILKGLMTNSAFTFWHHSCILGQSGTRTKWFCTDNSSFGSTYLHVYRVSVFLDMVHTHTDGSHNRTRQAYSPHHTVHTAVRFPLWFLGLYLSVLIAAL